MALIRLAFGNFLSRSAGDREAASGERCDPGIPTEIHSVRSRVIIFEERQGKFSRSNFK